MADYPSYPPSQQYPYPQPPAPQKKKVRPWVWAVAGIGGLLILTLGAMLFLLYAVDWGKWEKKFKGGTPFKAVEAWKDMQEAQKLKAKGRFPEAQDLYKKAIKKNPSLPNAHKELIKLAVINNNLADLESFYGGVLKENPGERALHYYLAQVYFMGGKYQEALNVFQNLDDSVKPSKGKTKKTGFFADDPGSISLNQAVIYAKMEKWGEAAARCEAVKKTPQGWKAHYVLGDIYAYRGDYDKALEEYRRALPNFSWDMDTYTRVGDLALALGKTQEAEEAYQQAVGKAFYSHNAKALTALVRMSLKEKKYQQALNYLGSLGQEEAETSPYHDLYGKTYLGLERYQLAERHLARALYNNPHDSDSLAGLGDSLAAQEKWEPAGGAYLKALEVNPYQREAYLGLQKIYTQWGQTNKAKKMSLMLAKIPKAESLKEGPGEKNFVPPRELELYGIYGGGGWGN